MLIAVVTWFTTGHKNFTGPESGGVVIEGAEPIVVVDVGESVGRKQTLA